MYLNGVCEMTSILSRSQWVNLIMYGSIEGPLHNFSATFSYGSHTDELVHASVPRINSMFCGVCHDIGLLQFILSCVCEYHEVGIVK